MDSVRRLQLATIGVMLVVLVVSGPLVGAVDLTPESRSGTVGDGTATVEVVDDPAADLRVNEGRFGTGVYYLRIPPAVVDVSAVEGRPRVVYTVTVPALDFQRSESQILHAGTDGRRTISMAPRAFAPETVTNESYRAEVLVRVQSFETDRVVYRRNVTVPVRGDR